LVVNPFSGQNYISDPDKIVVRDTESERKIIEIFEAAEFLVDKNIIYLTDENKLFEFLRNDLPGFRNWRKCIIPMRLRISV